MKKLLLAFIAVTTLYVVGKAQNTIDNSFFEQVDYRGAFGTEDWTGTWANFNPQNTSYPEANVVIEAGDITGNQTWATSPLVGRASFVDASLNDPFIETVNYIGAFGTADWTEGWSNFDPQNTIYPATTVTVDAGEITTNTTWTKANVYLLNGWVYVTSGATLTIEAGTVIRGDKANKGALIIEPGGKLIALGTVNEPIIFTSNQAPGSRNYGDWGGVILCGKALVNKVNPQIEGGPRTIYGGTNDADTSGTLKYVRIEFPGIAFQPDKEINGLTFGGVGSGTTIDYIQVSYSGDDSYEWFGGKVNCRHLIAYRGWDDDFDTDYGFRGIVQFGVALRDPAIADPGSGSNGFESDNDGTGSSDTPITNAVFTNISMFGPMVTPTTTVNENFKRGMHLRRNSKLQIFNAVFAGYVTGLYIEGPSITNAQNGDLKLKNVILAGCANDFGVASADLWSAADEANWFFTPAFHNDTLASNSDLSIIDPFNLASKPNFSPVFAYKLNGWAYVVDGAMLTIKPGTIIRGDKANKGALIVEPGGKLYAEGTIDKPIIFTSNQDAGSRTYGDWGGVILCGKAVVNKVSPQIEGGPRTIYGGNDDADNSGSLKYVRIEFPGIAFQPDKEINGLTFGGVGNGTSIDYIQVSYSGDDSYEWFGGMVNCKHLIAFRGWDDDFDTDYGFRGMVQYGVALRDPAIADPGSGSNGFESDNDGTGSSDTPYTQAVFSNISMFGPLVTPTTTINENFKRGLHLRRNTKLNVFNSIFAGYLTGLYIEGPSITNAQNNDLKFRFNLMAGTASDFGVASGDLWTAPEEATWFFTQDFHNDTLASNSELNITDPFNLTAPNFLPMQNSMVLEGSYWNLKTSVVDYSVEDKFADVYPNPVSDLMNIKSDNEITGVEIFNVIGQSVIMITDIRTENVTMDVSGLKTGLYVVKVSSIKGSQVLQISKR